MWTFILVSTNIYCVKLRNTAELKMPLVTIDIFWPNNKAKWISGWSNHSLFLNLHWVSINCFTFHGNQLSSWDTPLTAGEINLIVATKEKEKSRAFQSQQVSLCRPEGLTFVATMMLLVFIPKIHTQHSFSHWTLLDIYYTYFVSVDCLKRFPIELLDPFKSLSPESVTQLDANLIFHLNYVQILPTQ